MFGRFVFLFVQSSSFPRSQRKFGVAEDSFAGWRKLAAETDEELRVPGFVREKPRKLLLFEFHNLMKKYFSVQTKFVKFSEIAISSFVTFQCKTKYRSSGF